MAAKVHNENPKSLAVDLVSIFSLSASDEADAYNTRFSFPMPPSFTPRRGSQSPLDPEMGFTSMMQSPLSPLSPDSLTSGTSDYSFFSPLWSSSFTAPAFPPSASAETTLPPLALPEKAKETQSEAQKRRSLRPVLSLIPPAGPPPRDSPPPTPSSATHSPCTTDRPEALASSTKRICPSPDLDPELSAVESPCSSIASILLGLSNDVSDEELTDAEEDRDKVNIFGDWNLGAPSRSGSIVTITQRAINAAIQRGSLSTIVAGNTGRGRNGSVASDMYDNWEQAIDDIFATSRKPSLNASRRPSLASIALAASADGAASASTSLDVVEDTAFVMDEEMMRKLMESQFLVPSRNAPAPPSPSSGAPSLCESASNSTTSLVSTSADATPSASNTSSARSSFEEEDRSNTGHGSAMNQGPLTPIQEEHFVLEVDPILLRRPRRARPVPVVTSPTYPPVAGLRLARAEQGLPSDNSKANIPPNVPARPKRTAPLVTERLPPIQSVPEEGAFFSPSSITSHSSTNSPFSPFSPPVDVDSWPTWSSIDDAIASKRNARRPSGGAVTIMSKFSDDSIDISKPRKRRMKGVATKLSSPLSRVMAEEGEDVLEKRLRKNGMIAAKVNLNPGSSHTSYKFLGMRKRKDTDTSPTSKTSPTVKSSKDARPRTSWESNTSGSSDGKRTGLKRPPLPLELFIRA